MSENVIQQAKRCDYYRPWIMCKGRFEGSYAGTFYFDMRRGGYVCFDIPVPDRGYPVLLEGCPFCHEELPPKNYGENTPKPPRRGEMDVYGEGSE